MNIDRNLILFFAEFQSEMFEDNNAIIDELMTM